ncbi:hypothetical protein TTHERM_00343470 (macronuclear) [Tetrahymena thermophila SB210]|uniref:Uncharacterized protein n=1 Tax=Tetrahymena thermophila (strain SB210) TaxID=312017 RepID=I7LVF8_TETTS|nr:hypothetical protein TTHERM_00343470 [Tetrahymena thermophila SB210]EAR98148.1 hypothetical protein TTHERM_00343470 [Tetrahymena thermophila SB210]|eukprot:XP_001018393.1 hypothetical protein TTHERM_00343470 [Tetrahymena thermophila SB210]
MDQNQKVCPKCNSREKVVKIVYGKPGAVLIEQADRKEVFLGGCRISENPEKCLDFSFLSSNLAKSYSKE